MSTLRDVWRYRKTIFGVHFGGPKVKWKRPIYRPAMIFMFRLNLITGGGWTEDAFVWLRWKCAGTLEEHQALNS